MSPVPRDCLYSVHCAVRQAVTPNNKQCPPGLTPYSPSRASLTTASFAAIIAIAEMDPTLLLFALCLSVLLRMKTLQIRSLMLYFHVMPFMCLVWSRLANAGEITITTK